jgi:hypothetical protein
MKVEESDNIGRRDTPVHYSTSEPEYPGGVSGTSPQNLEIYITPSGAAVEPDPGVKPKYMPVAIRSFLEPSVSGMEVALVDYATPTEVSGSPDTSDAELAYFTGLTRVSGAVTEYLTFIGGEQRPDFKFLLAGYRFWEEEAIAIDYGAFYTAGGYYTPTIPGPPEDQVLKYAPNENKETEIPSEFIMATETVSGTTTSGVLQQNLECSFTGSPMVFHPDKYTYKFHVATGDEGDVQGPRWETIVISGSVLDIPMDMYSTISESQYYNSESNAGVVELVSYNSEVETVSGTFGYYYKEVICAVSGTGGYTFDVDLFPLKISNFSLDIDEFLPASGTICVDVTDDIYNVVTSGTYFIIDETLISGSTTFTPITDGYTMCYDSPTDFDNLLGATTVTVHAANDNGDILEQDFYLTSGYIVEYDNIRNDYGFKERVNVQGSAENLASCPNTGADAYFFTTEQKVGANLGATIIGVPWSEGNLGAEITPTTDTIYFYGKTFRIEVRAKDFAGNVMEPFTFEFKIEDEPE